MESTLVKTYSRFVPQAHDYPWGLLGCPETPPHRGWARSWGVMGQISFGVRLRPTVKPARVAQKKGHPATIFVQPNGADQDVLT